MTQTDPRELAGSDRQAARERGFRLLAATVAALFLSFVALGGVFLWYDSAARWVSHTHKVRSGIADVVEALTSAESAQRGYLLTGDRGFLKLVEDARADAETGITAVDVLTQDNPEQQQRIVLLRTQMKRRMAVLDDTLELRRHGDAVAAIRLMRQGEGIAAMSEVRRLVSELDRVEARLEASRTMRARTISALVLATLGIFALLLGWLFIKAVRDISLDREAEADTAERLRDLLRQRTLLLDEVNHRVKNSLQQIASVVRLQSRSATTAEAKHALDNTLSRIMAVGRVHEQIYKTSGEVGDFDAGLYARNLARELVDSMARDDIDLKTETDFAVLDMRRAGPIALILNELITNALKYGCPPGEASCIYVRFKALDDEYRLTVADDGEGLPAGFTTNSKSSLGMRAIHALARQLGGEFVVEDSKRGAAFTVNFPKSDS